jgi:3-methyladenine DNA glycosylase AlkD
MEILSDLHQELLQNIDQKTKNSAARVFKERIKFYGVRVLIITLLSKKYFQKIKNLSKTEILSLCEQLLKSGYIEDAFIALNWSYYLHEHYQIGDFEIFEYWLKKYISNWATCDTLCNHTIGTFIDMYPEFLSRLKLWTGSKNRWFRRAAAVTLIIPAREGKFLADILEISDKLLLDPDDLVQKGYGWMLKAASKLHEKEIFDYIIKHKKVMPRTALRYAIEKMPKDLQLQAMAK